MLVVTGLIIIIEALCEEWDRFLAFLEKSFIGIAMLIMVALSFMDYLRREVEFVDFEIDGGANASVVLMVWVGFLGASLATRQRSIWLWIRRTVSSPQKRPVLPNDLLPLSLPPSVGSSVDTLSVWSRAIYTDPGQDALPL